MGNSLFQLIQHHMNAWLDHDLFSKIFPQERDLTNQSCTFPTNTAFDFEVKVWSEFV